MNAPELAVSPKANRRVPGVNVPVAAPSCALDFTSPPSCSSVRPCAEGNSANCGRSAAGSSATAGGSTGADADVVVLAGDVGVDADALGEATGFDEEPHEARTSEIVAAAAVGTRRVRVNVMDVIMSPRSQT